MARPGLAGACAARPRPADGLAQAPPGACAQLRVSPDPRPPRRLDPRAAAAGGGRLVLARGGIQRRADVDGLAAAIGLRTPLPLGLTWCVLLSIEARSRTVRLQPRSVCYNCDGSQA